MTSLVELYCQTRTRLASLPEADLEARILVEHVTGTSSSDLVLRPDMMVPDEAFAGLDAAIARRLGGEPVFRIIGEREFYGLPLGLSRETLEPRPDTETLVEAVLPFVRARVAEAGSCRILDLGTGTGAIALALLAQVPQAMAVGVDVSEDALATAQANAARNGLAERFTALRSNWFEQVEGRFDLIVSNPPYIPSADIGGLSREVREHDPLRALDGGGDGLDAYREIAESSGKYLAVSGMVGVEIGYDQHAAVEAIFRRFSFDLINSFRDLGGNDRVILFRKA